MEQKEKSISPDRPGVNSAKDKPVRHAQDRLWNANYIRVMVTNFTLFFSFYLLMPLLPLYLSDTFHATKDMIGLVLSGYTLVALVVRPFSGFLVDSFPRKKVLLVCLAIYFLLFGGYLAAGGLVLFAVIRTIHGGPYGACTVANSTMAIDVLPSSRRNEGVGLYGLSNNLASAIAPTVGLFIYRYYCNFELLFWIAFVTAGIGLVNAYYIDVHKSPVAVRSQDAQGGKRPVLSLDRFFLLKGWYLALNICMFGFCWGVLSNYLAIYGKEHLGINGGTGVYFFILSAGLMLSRIQGNRSLREGRLLHNAMQGIVLSTVGYVLFIACPTVSEYGGVSLSVSDIQLVGYYASAVLIGLGNGHMWPAFLNLIISIASHNERGTANSTILTSWDLGMGIGILLGGVIAETLGYDAMFWTMAVVHIVGFLTFIFLTRMKTKGIDFSGRG